MKNLGRKLFPTVLVFALAILTSCAPFGTSKRDRIRRFEADLNGDRKYLYQNFLESETTDYAKIRDDDIGTTWDDWFPPGFPDPGTYSISVDSLIGDPSDGTIDGPDDFGGPKSITFYFVRSGIYWYLEGLTLEGSKIID
jgi:hypothetical protein